MSRAAPVAYSESVAPVPPSTPPSETALSSIVHRVDSTVPVTAPAGSSPGSKASSASTDADVDDDDDVEPPRGCFWKLCSCFLSSNGGDGGGGGGGGHNATVVPVVRSPIASLTSGTGRPALLPPLLPADATKKCLVLDLDETLVHSSFKPISKPDYIIPVEIEDVVHHVYVRKRPHCDTFLRVAAKYYEIVVFTASLSKYANPLLDKLDTGRVIRTRLFREHCVYHMGNYVKDMTLLGRPINSVIIVDNSPASYLFQPENAMACESFIENPMDRELLDMLPFLESIANVQDVRSVLHQWCSPGPGTILGPGPVSAQFDGNGAKSDPN